VACTVSHGAGSKHVSRVLFTLMGITTGAAFLILGGLVFDLRITLTDSSARAGIYRLVAAPAGRGALVAACLPAAIGRTGLARGYLRPGDCPAGAEPVAKVIGAQPGDVLEVEAGWVAVNGVKLTNSRTAKIDSSGRALGHVPWGVRSVEAGEVWLFGFNDPRSWDARYFGPVPRAGVYGVLRPVLTW
jgi:conjugative transfer signal peptidase TraF